MNTAPDPPRRSLPAEWAGLAAVVAGAAGAHLLLWNAGLLAWFATDVLVGHGGWAMCIAVAALVLASPFRARGLGASFAHGALCGAGWWCVAFAVFGADLYARNDRLFAAWIGCGLAVICAKCVAGPALVYAIARWSLLREPRGRAPLACVRALLFDQPPPAEQPASGSVRVWALFGAWSRIVRRGYL